MIGAEAIIALIGALVPTINNLISWIGKARDNLKQDAEMTPEQEAKLDEHISSIDQPPWWKES